MFEACLEILLQELNKNKQRSAQSTLEEHATNPRDGGITQLHTNTNRDTKPNPGTPLSTPRGSQSHLTVPVSVDDSPPSYSPFFFFF